MAEYIDREAALEALSNPFTMSMCLSVEECKGMRAARDIDRELIKRIPAAADVVEVVRCRDCKYSEEAWENDKGILICVASGMDITDNDYCSFGAKMEDDDD